MKKCLLLLFVVGLIASGCKSDSSSLTPGGANAVTGKTVVWAGLDYSHARMSPSVDFNDPAAIFPGMLNAWNALFIKERFPRLADQLGAAVLDGSQAVYAVNQAASPDQILTAADDINQTDLTPAIIQGMVKGYPIEQSGDVGLVFIIDRMVKTSQASAIYVVFFDLKTREVITSTRGVYDAGGFGFRNYWFGSVKRAQSKL